jgi:hypothetical protein
MVNRYTRCSTDRDTAEEHNLEWVTPGHPLFESIRRHTEHESIPAFKKGASFYSLSHDSPARIDFFRARIVDGLGQVVHEKIYGVEIDGSGNHSLCEATALVDFVSADPPPELPEVAHSPEPIDWLNREVLQVFLQKTREERHAEVQRIEDHVVLSLTELLQKADEEIGRIGEEAQRGVAGSEGRLTQAENRHADLLARREQRKQDLTRQRSLSLQGVERIASALVLPHPERETPEVRNFRPDPQTELVSMQVVMDHERGQGRQVYDVHERNLGYDVTSLDLNSGELRLIEVKGLKESTGTIFLTPNERRVAEDRPDCYWLYVVTSCGTEPTLQEPIKDPTKLDWKEVVKVAHYSLDAEAAFIGKNREQ